MSGDRCPGSGVRGRLSGHRIEVGIYIQTNEWAVISYFTSQLYRLISRQNVALKSLHNNSSDNVHLMLSVNPRFADMSTRSEHKTAAACKA